MSVNGLEFFSQKVDQFDSDAGDDRFTTDYLKAVNRVLQKIGIVSDTDSRPDALTNEEADIDLDAWNEPVLSHGVNFHLMIMGHRSGKELTLVKAEDWYKEALRDITLDRDLSATRADDNQESIGQIDDD